MQTKIQLDSSPHAAKALEPNSLRGAELFYYRVDPMKEAFTSSLDTHKPLAERLGVGRSPR